MTQRGLCVIYSYGCIIVWNGLFYRNESIENQITIKTHSFIRKKKTASGFYLRFYLFIKIDRPILYTECQTGSTSSELAYFVSERSAGPALTMQLHDSPEDQTRALVPHAMIDVQERRY